MPRTSYKPVVAQDDALHDAYYSDVGHSAGATTDPITVGCKADQNNTGEIDVRGLSYGTVFNPTANGDVTVTYYNCYERDGTAFKLNDEDIVSNSQTILAGESAAVITSMAGASFLLPTLGSGQYDLIFVFER